MKNCRKLSFSYHQIPILISVVLGLGCGLWVVLNRVDLSWSGESLWVERLEGFVACEGMEWGYVCMYRRSYTRGHFI